MRDEMTVDVTCVTAYRWTCPGCGAYDLADSEVQALAYGRRHLAWTHPAPTELQIDWARRSQLSQLAVAGQP